MASSSNQTTDRRGREKTAAAEGETIWELGPVRSRMTQNALGDHFVDQFQDNSEREPATACGDQESNVSRAQIPTVKIEPENKSESRFGDYFKKTYAGSSNRITRTVTAIPDQKVSAATRLLHGGLTGLGTRLNHQGELSRLGNTMNHQGDLTGLGNTMNYQGDLTGLGNTMNYQGGLTGLGNTMNYQEGLTGLGTTMNYQGDLTGLAMYPRTLNHQGETTALRMYSGTLNHPKNWEIMRGMQGRCDLIEGIRPGSNASSSGMRGPTDLIQSRADQFNFRMGLLERQNQRPTSNLQADISNPVSGFVGEMTLEEIERQKQKSLMNLQQWEQAQNIRLRMELEAQKRREVMAKARENEMMKAREDDEMMKLIQAEQLKRDLVKQDLARQTEDSGMGAKSRQEDLHRLQKEVEMLKKQMISKSPDNSELKTNPNRSGVKYRLGVTARLGNPQELKKKVFERLGKEDDDNTEHMGEFRDMQHGNVECRWKRGNGDKDSTLKNQYFKKRKNDKDDSHELPADLVLTELSDAGPVPAKTSGAIPAKASGVIPLELVLTEFGENGPVKAQTELEKLEARARKVTKIK